MVVEAHWEELPARPLAFLADGDVWAFLVGQMEEMKVDEAVGAWAWAKGDPARP